MSKVSFESVRHFFLYTFVFLLGYEYWDKFSLLGGMTVPKLVGLLYFTACMSNPKKMFAVHKYNKTLLLLVFTLWCCLILSSLFSHITNARDITFHLSIFQLFILFWLLSNEVNLSEDTRANVILFFVYGVFSIYILLLLGIGIQSSRGGEELESIEGVRRVWFMGLNPNNLGNLAALAFILSLSSVFNISKRYTYRILMLIPFFSFPFMVGLSGSAGAFFILLLGVILLFTLKHSNALKKCIYIILGGGVVLAFLNQISDFEGLINKVTHVLNTGDTSGRSAIWLKSLNIINENVFLGTGDTTGVQSEFIKLGINYNSAHNAYLDILLWGGVLSFIPYLSFQLSLLKSSYTFYQRNSEPIYLIILLCLVLILMKSGGALTAKYIWVLLGVCCLRGVKKC